MSSYVGMVGASLLPNVGGLIGAFYTRKAITEWYEPKLKKPSFTPPNYVFGPVWTAIYTSSGYASYLIWEEGGGLDGDSMLPLTIYGTSLALNWAYTPLTFGLRRLDLGLIDISLLCGSVVGCIYTFWPVSRTAAYLMIPYGLWVAFATVIHYRLWKDNREEAPKDE